MKYGWNKNRDVWNDIPKYLVTAKWTDLHFQKESLNIIPNKTGILVPVKNSEKLGQFNEMFMVR